MNFQDLKMFVLSKTNSSNIHMVQNKLGIILNLMESKEYYKLKNNNSKILEADAMIDKILNVLSSSINQQLIMVR